MVNSSFSYSLVITVKLYSLRFRILYASVSDVPQNLMSHFQFENLKKKD
jgi:hypothetical protein